MDWLIALTLLACSVKLLLCFRWRHATPQATILATAKQPCSVDLRLHDRHKWKLYSIVEFVWLYLEPGVNSSCQYCHKWVYETDWSHQHGMPQVGTTKIRTSIACMLALSFLYRWRHSQNLSDLATCSTRKGHWFIICSSKTSSTELFKPLSLAVRNLPEMGTGGSGQISAE